MSRLALLAGNFDLFQRFQYRRHSGECAVIPDDPSCVKLTIAVRDEHPLSLYPRRTKRILPQIPFSGLPARVHAGYNILRQRLQQIRRGCFWEDDHRYGVFFLPLRRVRDYVPHETPCLRGVPPDQRNHSVSLLFKIPN